MVPLRLALAHDEPLAGASHGARRRWPCSTPPVESSSWAKANLSGTIPAGGYYLVALATSGSVGGSLPAADATGTMNMSGTSGKLALVTNQQLLSCGGSSGACLPGTSIRDFVGYGSADQFEGTAAAPTLSNTRAALRARQAAPIPQQRRRSGRGRAGAPQLAHRPRTMRRRHARRRTGGTPDAATASATASRRACVHGQLRLRHVGHLRPS